MIRQVITVVVGIFFLSVIVAFAAKKESDADPFWRSFRQAVISNDNEKVSALTRFPFEVRGPDDSDPVRHFDRISFPGILKRVLVQPVFVRSNGKSVTKSMLQIIEEKDLLEKSDYHTPTFLQIEQFEFQRIKGHWVFTRAYLEE